MATSVQAKELSWFPVETDRFLSSVRWNKMKDFQRGWYWHMCLLMTRSKPLGYLPLDGRLWALAGACSKQYWDNHAELVLSAFKVAEFDGQQWVYSEKILKVLNEQSFKHDQAVEKGRLGGRNKLKSSKSSLIYSFEFLTIWEKNIWKCIGKPKAFKAFQNSLQIIQQEKKCREDQALEFLADAIEEFKSSPAGKDHGMFEGYSSPHPASWLNAQRYFDDRRTWRPGAANVAGTNGVGKIGAGEAKSFAEESCPRCRGTSWDTTSGKAVRCECWKRNREAYARTSGAAK